MKIITGYLYHIKDEFFDYINEKTLMINHEKGRSRPTYLTIKDKKILWFIPLSSKIDKYEKIISDKVKKYGECKTILIRKVAGKKVAVLLQNAFPTLEKYIDHPHIIKGKPLKVVESLKHEILNNFNYMLSMKKDGRNLFWTNIDGIKEKLLIDNNDVNK